MSDSATLLKAVTDTVPAGRWAVGVSGGADSVALLSVLRARADLQLHVVHLDHQLRGDQSTEDARFVQALAQSWSLTFTVARREEVEPLVSGDPSLANPSARYRVLRLFLFKRVISEQLLAGVILAHHADDQAETVLQRLIRGSGYTGLAGMSPRASVGGLLILRPLLNVSRSVLREYLVQHGLEWREDESNKSGKYLRNRLRVALQGNHQLTQDLIVLAKACGELRQWSRSAAPVLGEQFSMGQLAGLPTILAEQSARRWLIDRGVLADETQPQTIRQLLTMAHDAASAARQDFPGGVHVRRRKGIIQSESSASRDQ